MKTKWFFLALLTLATLAVAAAWLGGCDDDDDDDNDSGGGACADFCDIIGQCGLSGEIGVASKAECLDYCAGIDGTLGGCVVNAADCTAAAACFDTGDDDDDDTTGDDDDDTAPPDSTPQLTGQTLYISAQDIAVFSEASGLDAIGIHERAILHVKYKDEACDLAGGKMYYNLDGAGDEEYGTLPSYVECRDTELGNQIFGYEFMDIAGAMDEGHHSLRFWWTDSAGNESNIRTYAYDVADIATAIGGTMDDFTLTDENGDSVSLSDYAGKIVVITGTAEWCVYCGQEANELATDMQNYIDNSNPVAILGLMGETASGSADVTQATLQGWVDDHGWAGLIPCLDDGGWSTQYPYWIGAGVPFNMVVDGTRTIRAKWHGYGSGLTDYVVQLLLAESK